MSGCPTPVSWEQLVDYWAGELAGDVEAALEEHLFACPPCAAASAGVAALTEALRTEIATLLTAEAVDRLRARGLRIAENRMRPDERRQVSFPADVDLLIHRLGGLDLSRAVRVGFSMRIEATDRVVVEIDDAPFDRQAGEVLVACQHHFDVFPPDTVARVTARDEHGAETVAEYTILHLFA